MEWCWKSKYSTMSETFKVMGSLAQQHLSSLEEQHHKIKSVAECPKAIWYYPVEDNIGMYQTQKCLIVCWPANILDPNWS